MARTQVHYLLWLLVVAAAMVATKATLEDDEKQCADQLQNLASCIPYVSGTAKAPSAQCCDDAEKVRSAQPKCLCVLIKESTDPSLGLPVNTTLALQMPKACHSDAKVSDCPSILKLPPGSPDAKIFMDESGDATTTTNPSSPSSSSPATTGSSDSTTTSSTGSSSSKATSANNGARLQGFVAGASVCLMLSICALLV